MPDPLSWQHFIQSGRETWLVDAAATSPQPCRGGRCYRQDRWEHLVRTPTVSWSDLVVDLHRCLGSMCRPC